MKQLSGRSRVQRKFINYIALYAYGMCAAYFLALTKNQTFSRLARAKMFYRLSTVGRRKVKTL